MNSWRGIPRFHFQLPHRPSLRKLQRQDCAVSFEACKNSSNNYSRVTITMSTDEETELALLRSHLGITPKTARLLYSSGYTNPQSLANSTPNEIVSKFAILPGLDMKKAKDYARPARRMVMLGAIQDAEEAAAVVKDCKVWTNKHLMSIGIWEDGFNDLTGVEIRSRMQSVPSNARR